MRGIRCVLALAVLAVPQSRAFADPPTVKAPKRVTFAKGDWYVLKVETDGKAVKFVPYTSAVKVFPAGVLNDPKSTVLTSNRVGVHKLWCVTGNADGPSDPVTVEVEVTPEAAPDPDEPPTPPNPPNPPVPPVPSDPLVRALAEAYKLDTAPDRRERLLGLADVMRSGAAYTNDATVLNSAVLANWVSARTKQVVADSLPNTRKAIGSYLGGEFGQVVLVLDATNRPKIAAAYNKLAAALEEIAK